MSRVMLIAADRPLPLRDCQEERTTVVTLPNHPDLGEMAGREMSVTAVRGFLVSEHAYYRPAVEDLGLSMKPHQRQFEAENNPEDLDCLLTYLRENCLPGEEVELWNLWVGWDREEKVPRYRGSLADFDLETLAQFLLPPADDGGIGQCMMTVTI